MKKIIAFAGSNNSKSINHQLLTYITTLCPSVELFRLTEYEAPIYSPDLEKAEGIPDSIVALEKRLSEADELIISCSEYNGNQTPVFKNTLDWLSRYKRSFLADKKVLLTSASPGPKGGSNSLHFTQTMLPFFGATIIGTFSLGKFGQTFADGKIVDEALDSQLKEVLKEAGYYQE